VTTAIVERPPRVRPITAAREARWSEVLGEWSPEEHPEVRELVERVRASFAAEPPSRG
jgi:hypothetical protein